MGTLQTHTGQPTFRLTLLLCGNIILTIIASDYIILDFFAPRYNFLTFSVRLFCSSSPSRPGSRKSKMVENALAPYTGGAFSTFFGLF